MSKLLAVLSVSVINHGRKYGNVATFELYVEK